MNAITRINRFLFRYICAVILVIGSTLIVNADQEKRIAVILHVNDAISPAIYDYIHRGLQSAVERNAAVVILQLDTPGGLDTSMRDIIRAIIASPIPVAIYVAPSGARAASAGTYMLYAAHIAAMAPGTNLGAATPVQIGGFPDLLPDDNEQEGKKAKQAKKADQDKAEDAEGDDAAEENQQPEPTGDAMTHKMVNDAVAYIRSLAEMRGRNAEWAEQAVRQAASLSSEQALLQGVIEIVATDVDDLLEKVNGREVNVNGRNQTLDTG